MNIKSLFHWTIILPILSAIFYFSGLLVHEGWFSAIGAMLLIGSVLSAVHHAEVVAHKVGEPFGTIILAICITILEVSLIISLMIAGGEKAMTENHLSVAVPPSPVKILWTTPPCTKPSCPKETVFT
jgi:Ca2+:H+ antiporter